MATNPSTPTWYARRATLPSGLHLVSAHRGDEFADGATIHEGRLALWSVEPSPEGLLRVVVSKDSIPDAPSTWFVHVDEPRAAPPAANLVAYATGDYPAGTVINQYQFGSLGLPSEEQIGAVRWFRDGLVHQVFVAPAWRRRQLATLLVYAASAFHQANGWPGHLHDDGRHTELGDRFLAELPHTHRVKAATGFEPPMDVSAS